MRCTGRGALQSLFVNLTSKTTARQCALLTLGLLNLSAWCGTAAAADGCRCTWTAEQAGSLKARWTGPPGLSPAVGPAWRTPPCRTLPRNLNAPPGESCHCRRQPRAAERPARPRLTCRTWRGEETGGEDRTRSFQQQKEQSVSQNQTETLFGINNATLARCCENKMDLRPERDCYTLHKHHCKCIIQTSEDLPSAQACCRTCIIGAGSNKTFTCENKSALVSSYDGTR